LSISENRKGETRPPRFRREPERGTSKKKKGGKQWRLINFRKDP